MKCRFVCKNNLLKRNKVDKIVDMRGTEVFRIRTLCVSKMVDHMSTGSENGTSLEENVLLPKFTIRPKTLHT